MTELINAHAIKVGNAFIFEGAPVVAKSIDISKTGKRGASKCRIEAEGILAVLVNGAGGVMPTSEITSRAKLAPGAGASIISDAFIALERPLKEIGLTLKYVNKLGYSINKAG